MVASIANPVPCKTVDGKNRGCWYLGAHTCAGVISSGTVMVPTGETVRPLERQPISSLRLTGKIVSDLDSVVSIRVAI